MSFRGPQALSDIHEGVESEVKRGGSPTYSPTLPPAVTPVFGDRIWPPLLNATDTYAV
jgi:hypothetical protein